MPTYLKHKYPEPDPVFFQLSRLRTHGKRIRILIPAKNTNKNVDNTAGKQDIYILSI